MTDENANSSSSDVSRLIARLQEMADAFQGGADRSLDRDPWQLRADTCRAAADQFTLLSSSTPERK